MANTNNESFVEYKGKLEGLVIKVNGVIVYSNKSKKPPKSAALQKDQEDLAIAAKFASCINHVPELSRIWKQTKWKRRRTQGENKVEYTQKANFGKPSAYNKIVSANRKEISSVGRPNIKNVILPVSNPFPYNYSANFNTGGVDIELHISTGSEKKILDNSTIIPVGIFCFFDAKKTGNAKFEMISKYYETEYVNSSDSYRIHFPITPDETKTIKKYKCCVFYFAIVEHARSLKRVRWFRYNKGIEFSIEEYPKKSVVFGTGVKDGIMD